jgi:hypothetical protein
VSGYNEIVLDVWIAIEELVSLAEDDNAAVQKDQDCDGECDAQRWNASLFNHRHQRGTARLHVKPVPVLSIGFYDASAGFSGATEERIATPSLEAKA